MPKSSPAKLTYQKERNARPEEVKKRQMNNVARQRAIREGKAHVGDGTQVDHKVMLDQGGSNAPSNTRVVSRGYNAGWRGRNPEAYTKKR